MTIHAGWNSIGHNVSAEGCGGTISVVFFREYDSPQGSLHSKRYEDLSVIRKACNRGDRKFFHEMSALFVNSPQTEYAWHKVPLVAAETGRPLFALSYLPATILSPTTLAWWRRRRFHHHRKQILRYQDPLVVAAVVNKSKVRMQAGSTF